MSSKLEKLITLLKEANLPYIEEDGRGIYFKVPTKVEPEAQVKLWELAVKAGFENVTTYDTFIKLVLKPARFNLYGTGDAKNHFDTYFKRMKD